jgi:hypothetical protein
LCSIDERDDVSALHLSTLRCAADPQHQPIEELKRLALHHAAPLLLHAAPLLLPREKFMEQRLVLLPAEASVRFGVLKLREPYLQNLPHCHPAVAVFVDEQELLRIGQASRNHHFPPFFN